MKKNLLLIVCVLLAQYAISYNHVYTAIATDNDIWLGTYEDITHFIPKTGEFEHYSQQWDYNGLFSKAVYSICQNGEGKLLVGTHTGIYSFDGSRYQEFENTCTALTNHSRKPLLRIHNNSLYVSEAQTIHRLKDNQWTSFRHMKEMLSDPNYIIRMEFGLNDEMFVLEESKKCVSLFDLDNQQKDLWTGELKVNDFVVFDNKVVVATDDGLYLFEEANKPIPFLEGISQTKKLVVDKENTLWILSDKFLSFYKNEEINSIELPDELISDNPAMLINYGENKVCLVAGNKIKLWFFDGKSWAKFEEAVQQRDAKQFKNDYKENIVTTNNVVYINLDTEGEVVVSVFETLGLPVKEMTLKAEKGKVLEFPITDLKEGAYVLRIKSSLGSFQHIIVKK